MTIKINDGLTRSSRTRARRRALGLCTDCGNILFHEYEYSRCLKCRVKRNELRKIHKLIEWEVVGK